MYIVAVMMLRSSSRITQLISIQCKYNNNWAVNVMNYLQKGKTHKIRQIGDPVLRTQAKPVELAYLVDPDFKQLVDDLVSTMRRKNAAGLAAPQIGIPLQVIAVEITGYDLKMAMKKYGSKGVSKMQMTLFPLKVLINPKIKYIDPSTVTFKEGCLSMENYTAMVPRANEIAVEALNTEGVKINFNAIGWTARIIQHEIDHLNGNLFIDSMTYKTLANGNWRSFKS